MKKKQFEISTNDRVSVFIELADAYRQLGQQVCSMSLSSSTSSSSLLSLLDAQDAPVTCARDWLSV